MLTEREEKNSVAIASNESFRRVDEDVHRSPPLRGPRRPSDVQRRIIETGTHSFRPASTRARAQEPAKVG